MPDNAAYAQPAFEKRPTMVEHPGKLPPAMPRVAVAMGVFDGVHLGHQAILANLVKVAAETSATPVALFFSPHPRAVLFPPAPPMLTSFEHKARLLALHGAEAIVCLPFSKELARLEPEEFLERYFIVPGLNVTAFCVGRNWRFGRFNSGDTSCLEAWACAHSAISRIVPPVCIGGETVSSTRIRAAIQNGKLADAAAMLGRHYSVSGIVRHGNGIGGPGLGFPTANIVDPSLLVPPFGVYAATAFWRDDKGAARSARGIVYAGEAPTIRDASRHEVVVELHLFDINENLYDVHIQVEFHEFIRPSMKFQTKELLAEQIKKDIDRVIQLFG